MASLHEKYHALLKTSYFNIQFEYRIGIFFRNVVRGVVQGNLTLT